jgi:glutathione peroxidase
MKSSIWAVAGLALLAGCMTAQSDDKPAAQTEPKEKPVVLNFTVKNIDGKDVDLSKYKGKVVLIFNAASNCGYTKQYAGLQKLHEKYQDQGLAVLGFPANNFGAQEPGSDEEIATFCRKDKGVTFDMFSKVSVKGDDKAPLFALLTSGAGDDKLKGDIGWNFEKFLIGRDGKLLARYKSSVTPESDTLTKAIEAELAKK